MTKVLFILKKREDFNSKVHNSIGLTTGLYNSAYYVQQMLEQSKIESKLVVVTDNNCIDREVFNYKPTHVIIEALWVVPSKFYELKKLHPDVKWIIRVHSEMPFMANEGMAMSWFGDYSSYKNVIIACNSLRMTRELRLFLSIKNRWTTEQQNEKVIYLPNYYPKNFTSIKQFNNNSEYINIGCFGAVRPLKNHLLQALSAVEFAESIDKKLAFHINAGRIEMKGEPVLHNLRGLFEHLYTKGHKLVSHSWKDREGFLELCSNMDIGMQVSFSETFNIVAADLISQGVPIVCSDEIPWSFSKFNAIPEDSKSIVDALNKTYKYRELNIYINRFFLSRYINKTRNIWKRYLK